MTDDPRSAAFPSTRWSLLAMVRSVDPDIRRQALDELLRLYQPAVLAHLRGPCRLDAEKAEEIAQAFLVEKVVERDLLGTADRQKGRLRSLVLRSLENFLIDRLRRDRRHVSLADDYLLPLPSRELPPADHFDVAWARQVLVESLRRMREQCQAQGRQQVWALFEARVARPALTGSPPPAYQELIGQFGFASPEQASNALVNAKRHFRRVLDSVIAEYAVDEEVESEIMELHQVLARAGPLGITPAGAVQSLRGALGDDRAAPPADSTASSWAQLLEAPPQRDELWSADELRQLLVHQLSLPLADVLKGLDDSVPLLLAKARAASGAQPRSKEKQTPSPLAGEGRGEGAAVPSGATAGLPGSGSLTTLGDLFTHPSPPLELLDAVKRWARRGARDDASSLPGELTSLIYFAAIAAALVRHGQRITKSDDATLRFGFKRILSQHGIHESLTRLISAARNRLAE